MLKNLRYDYVGNRGKKGKNIPLSTNKKNEITAEKYRRIEEIFIINVLLDILRQSSRLMPLKSYKQTAEYSKRAEWAAVRSNKVWCPSIHIPNLCALRDKKSLR